MTSLAVEELKTTLNQEILVGDNNLNVEAVRPRIYKHNAPAGSLQVQIRDTNDKIIASSNSVTISSVSASAFFHGFIRFDINAGLKAGTTYRLFLVPSGYTFAESDYIGWVKDHEDRQVGIEYTPNAGFQSPLGTQVWTRDRKER